jgi:hypothetical protein
MKRLSVAISDIEFNKFGIKDENLAFSDLIEIVSRELTRQNLNKSIELSEKHGISTMTMEEITQEVNAVRRNAKDNN